MKFHEVASAFEMIQPIQSRLEMTRQLAHLLSLCSPSEARIVCDLALGQLHAQYIGTQFNIAQKTAAKAVALLFGADPKDIEQASKSLGDLGLVVAKLQWQTEHNLTVLQLFNRLEILEQMEGIGSVDEKTLYLKQLLQELDPLSAKFVIRIILGSLRLGFSDMTLIDAMSWMIAGDKSLRSHLEDAYNVCADIGLIAATLKADGIDAIKSMRVRVGIPIRPSAAERLPNAKAIIEKIGACAAEPKIDGFRLQVHIDMAQEPHLIKFFSRNLLDMSLMFPELTESCKNLEVSSLICEGEAIAYDPDTQSFLPFQETVKRRRKHGIEQASQEFPLRVFLFDILYLNGNELMDTQYVQRRKILADIVAQDKTGVLSMIDEKHIATAQELEDYFYDTVSAGLEGLVVKRLHAHYVPGKRNFNWIKLKRQEEGHLEDTIDCVILGYYAGSGKRASFGLGAFLVGIFDESHDRFETIAKIGTGLKDDEWISLKKLCDEKTVDEKPKNVVCAKELFPDVWVAPEIVCCVRADEITISPLHTAGKTAHKNGFALRFPRFMGYRTDKSARQATTVKEIEHLFENQLKR